jgi:hypothetical protein
VEIMIRQALSWAGLVVVLLASAAPGTAESREIDPGTQGSRFLGPDGEMLPFPDDAEALEFLRTARVIRSRRAEGGISGARKVLLEWDGVRAHAVFRTVAITRFVCEVAEGRLQSHFRDHHANEVAAYRLARALGLDMVPPTVARRIGGREGSLQLWIEGAEPETVFRERDLPPVERLKHGMQVDQMNVFDNLINNVDRNNGNFLTVASGAVWWVDHTRSFSRVPSLPEESRIGRIDRDFWLRLREMPDEGIVEALSPHLQEPEIEGVLKRRRLLVALLESRLEEEGLAGVLFSLAYARPPVH